MGSARPFVVAIFRAMALISNERERERERENGPKSNRKGSPLSRKISINSKKSPGAKKQARFAFAPALG
jgi:hypothetical protein